MQVHTGSGGLPFFYLTWKLFIAPAVFPGQRPRAVAIVDEALTTKAGTPYYVAPQALERASVCGSLMFNRNITVRVIN